MVATEPTRALIEDLRENSHLIRTLSESFPPAAKSLKIVTCRELLETPTMQLSNDGVWKRTGPKEMMVNETSACLYLPNEERISIYANHSMIAKLGDGAGSSYHTIKDHIASHVRDAPGVIRRRILKVECAAALSELYPLAQFVHAIVCASRSTPLPSLRVKNSVGKQVLFLEHFAAFLLDEDLGRMLEDPGLSINHTQEVAESLRQLNAVFSSYRSLALQYYKPYQDAVQLQEPLKLMHRDRSKVAVDVSASEILQHERSSQALFEDSKLGELVRQCRESTMRLRTTLVYASLRSLDSQSGDDPEKLQHKMQLCGMGSSTGAKRQLLLTQRSESVEVEALKGSLEKHDILLVGSSNIRFARYQPEGSLSWKDVIVEYKKYDPDLSADDQRPEVATAQRERLFKVKRGMRQLSALLQESAFGVDSLMNEEGPDLDSIGAFRFLGWIDDADRYQLALLFEIPSGMTAQSLANCHSLQTYIDHTNSESSAGEAPSVRDKLQIARVLCLNILKLHACGWVHKSIRSENIILVPQTHDPVSEGSRGSRRSYVQHFKNFEYSRPQIGRSSGRADFDPDQNLYRHPERQNVPDTTFQKEHDLYAIGVILLEIGRWQTVSRIFQKHIKAARENRPFPQPNTIRDLLLKLVAKTSLGPEYAAAVTICLTGDFGVEKDDKQQANLGLAFRQQVLDVIEMRLNLGNFVQ